MIARSMRNVSSVLVLGMLLASKTARASGDDPFFSDDKALHFSVSFGIASVGYAAFVPISESRASRLIFAASIGIAAGAGKELIDLTGSGDPSWKDFAWDAGGVAAGTLVAWAIDLALEGSHPVREQMLLTPRKNAPLSLTLRF